MTPAAAQALAQWLGAIRAKAPGLSLSSLEALLHVAGGEDSRAGVEERMCSAAPIATTSVSRALGALRGRGAWRGDHWLRSLDWLAGTPHPHIPGAFRYRVSTKGREILSNLNTDVFSP